MIFSDSDEGGNQDEATTSFNGPLASPSSLEETGGATALLIRKHVLFWFFSVLFTNRHNKSSTGNYQLDIWVLIWCILILRHNWKENPQKRINKECKLSSEMCTSNRIK